MLVLTAGLWLSVSTGWAQKAAVKPKPPETKRVEVKETLHGVEIVDPYRWLEDQESPDTRAWIEAQNKYTESRLGAWPGRAALKQRLTELLKIDVIGVPTARAGRYFFTQRKANQDLPVIYLRQGMQGKDEVLIDPHPMSADHRTSVSLLEVSQDGRLVAYGIRQGGEDEVAIRLMNVDTRQDLADQLPRARYFGLSLKPDQSGLYYTRFEKEGPRVYYHAMGADPGGDKQIFGEGYGPEIIVDVNLSDDGRYLVLEVARGASSDKSEIYFQDLARGGPMRPLVKDVEAYFSPRIGGDHLYLHTNWEAPNWRVMAVDFEKPARDNWKTVVPESDSVIEGVSLAGGKIFVTTLENVRSVVKAYSPDGQMLGKVALPGLGSVGSFSGRWSSNEAFYSFTSFHIRTNIYRYDVAQGTQELWAQVKVPADTSRFAVRQVWYESKDRTLVPMFLVHQKGIRLDGSHPTLLTGYGGFNLSLTPTFSSLAVAWVERGGVYAVANLRGGNEFGEKWHRAGMLEKKQNVFDDFLAAAEWLIENDYTRPEKLAIRGGSNGGLLVGAALTQRPELFQAVICNYPLLDMLRYQNFLVARFWVSEYGSAENAEQFPYIYAYSPYQRVQPGTKYPAVLFVTGDSDTRVAPLHARKMAALLQAATGSDRPVLLHYDTKAGHVGATPVSKQIDDVTDELSFLFWQLGVRPPARKPAATKPAASTN
ncbi:MAG: prolyl oligopeptidase family serine peptidase [Candidatus Acidiferrales bacterium]